MKLTKSQLKQIIKEELEKVLNEVEYEKQFGEFLPRDLITMGEEVLKNPDLDCPRVMSVYEDVSNMMKKLEQSAEGGWGMPDELEKLTMIRNAIVERRSDCVNWLLMTGGRP